MHSSERSCFKIRDDQCWNNYSLCIPKRQAPSVSGLATSASRRMRSQFIFRIGRHFRLVLNECLFAPFLPPTLHYFKAASPLSHPFDLDDLKNLDSNMKARWFRMVRVWWNEQGFWEDIFWSHACHLGFQWRIHPSQGTTTSCEFLVRCCHGWFKFG